MAIEGRSSDELRYFISCKQSYVVISFDGSFTRTSEPVLERCRADATSNSAKFVVFSFHGVTSVERPIIPSLVRLQKHFRDQAAQVRVCFLPPKVKTLLIDAGAVRLDELKADLAEALQSFPKG